MRTVKAEIITLRAIALKRNIRSNNRRRIASRDHNATSYSTETRAASDKATTKRAAEIITLRAIALKPFGVVSDSFNGFSAEIITLRAIALKHSFCWRFWRSWQCRDHNATSYSTETNWQHHLWLQPKEAEIITLRAIALKLGRSVDERAF